MVIFDFDQTLVDTSPVEHLRQQRRWKDVIARAPDLVVYDGLHQIIAELAKSGRPMAILTKSPNVVPERFVALHKWPIPIVLGFHQVTQRKPHPEGLHLAMERAGVKPKDVIHVGDRAEDTVAAKAASVLAVGAAWGLSDRADLTASSPDHLFTTVADFRKFLKLG